MISRLIKYIITITLFIIMNMQNSFSEELFINASSVEIDKTGKIVYAKGNVEIYDKDNNTIFSEIAEYDKVKGIVKTVGTTKILTSEKYEVTGADWERAATDADAAKELDARGWRMPNDILDRRCGNLHLSG